MKFLEKDLEQIIYSADKELLAQRGLEINGTLIRQLRIGNYGTCDLISHKRPKRDKFLGYTTKGLITVYELKQDKIGISAFLQALGYLQGIKSYLSKYHEDLVNCYDYRIVLIGKEIDTHSTYCYLPNFTELNFCDEHVDCHSKFCLENYTYEYELDGVYFNNRDNFDLEIRGF